MRDKGKFEARSSTSDLHIAFYSRQLTNRPRFLRFRHTSERTLSRVALQLTSTTDHNSNRVSSALFSRVAAYSIQSSVTTKSCTCVNLSLIKTSQSVVSEAELAMDALIEAVKTTPIIDHHAHNLLLDSAIDDHDFMAATSEATGPALKFASSTLSHLRALKQFSEILECESTWEAVEGALKVKRKERDNAWARRCFQGIETVLIDDGLNTSDVYPYDWHDRLTRSKCKRIVRIEKVAETIMTDQLEECRGLVPEKRVNIHARFVSRFTAAIEKADCDPEVVGFKSVICYRVGLKVPAFDNDARSVPLSIEDLERLSRRFEDERLNPYLVHLTAKAVERSGSKKPLQFHTGVRR